GFDEYQNDALIRVKPEKIITFRHRAKWQGPPSDKVSWHDFLAGTEIGVVATTAKDGTPHAVPVDILYTVGVVHIWCQRRSKGETRPARPSSRRRRVPWK